MSKIGHVGTQECMSLFIISSIFSVFLIIYELDEKIQFMKADKSLANCISDGVKLRYSL